MISVPPPQFWNRELRLFVLIMVSLLRFFPGVEISSWFRTEPQNIAVGGVPGSLHLRGLAMDLVGPPIALATIADVWTQIGLDAVVETDHLHLELDGPAVGPTRPTS